MLFVRLKEGTYTSFSPLFFIGEFCFGIALVYNKKLIPIVSCLMLFFVDWIMVVPFFLFLFMINIKSIRFGKIITFVGTNSLALFLLHESFMNVIFNKWSLFGLNRYLAILLLLVISFALVFLSNKLQRYLLSKIK
jgi:peptidoglycan/LPS O-acetylase OafA/YrhL